MTTATRSQRVFNSIFPPEESPFLSGFVRTEQLRPDQQRYWDVVTRLIQPHFSPRVAEIRDSDLKPGSGDSLDVLTSD